MVQLDTASDESIATSVTAGKHDAWPVGDPGSTPTPDRVIRRQNGQPASERHPIPLSIRRPLYKVAKEAVAWTDSVKGLWSSEPVAPGVARPACIGGAAVIAASSR
ncbi:hypothetical protein PG984_015970 [Apiospora sp. TS-2023a]